MSLVPANEVQSTAVMPREVVRKGEQVAEACRAIVLQCSMQLQGKSYIKAEGWQALAAANGLSPRISVVEELDGGDIRAVCDLVRLSDGEIVASSEGYVGVDEPMWSRRPKYARRAMAQTRATSRACRSALAWVVPLLNAGLETTPAEEIPHDAEVVYTHASATTAAPVVADKPQKAAKATRQQIDKIVALYAQAQETGRLDGDYWEKVKEDYKIKTKKVSDGLLADQAEEIINHLSGIITLGANS